MTSKDKIREKVLSFYQELPFNIYDSPVEGSEKIDQNNVFDAYPILKNIFKLNDIKNIIDVGCGGGWFINSLSSMFPEKFALGIDFNKVAIVDDQKKFLRSLSVSLLNLKDFKSMLLVNYKSSHFENKSEKEQKLKELRSYIND